MDAFFDVGLQILLGFEAGYYRQTMFSTHHEVHALQLGVYSGILVLSLRTRGYRHLSTVLTLVLFAFTMGFPDIYAVCHKTGGYCGSLPVQLQPWYFLTGLIGTAIVAPSVLAELRRAWRWYRTGASTRAATGAEHRTPSLSVDAGTPGSATNAGDADD